MNGLKRVCLGTFLIGTFEALLACGDGAVTLPEPPSIPVPPVPDPPPPFPGVDFSWADTRGILVFAGTQAQEGQIRALDNRLRAQGWPTPTYHVCAEVASWEHTPWADGPAYDSSENLENLRRFLRTTADLRSQVLLDIICTIRDDGTSFDALRAWTKVVAVEAAKWNHIAIHICNEHWHPQSSIRSVGKIRTLRDDTRVAGFRGLVGSDDNSSRPGDFDYTLRGLGFIPDFHPYRNPDPTKAELREMRERNGLPLVISEPTAYSSWRGGGCCTASRKQIRRYMERAESLGIVWTFHSTDGLEWPTKTFEWIP